MKQLSRIVTLVVGMMAGLPAAVQGIRILKFKMEAVG